MNHSVEKPPWPYPSNQRRLGPCQEWAWGITNKNAIASYCGKEERIVIEPSFFGGKYFQKKNEAQLGSARWRVPSNP